MALIAQNRNKRITIMCIVLEGRSCRGSKQFPRQKENKHWGRGRGEFWSYAYRHSRLANRNSREP